MFASSFFFLRRKSKENELICFLCGKFRSSLGRSSRILNENRSRRHRSTMNRIAATQNQRFLLVDEKNIKKNMSIWSLMDEDKDQTRNQMRYLIVSHFVPIRFVDDVLLVSFDCRWQTNVGLCWVLLVFNIVLSPKEKRLFFSLLCRTSSKRILYTWPINIALARSRDWQGRVYLRNEHFLSIFVHLKIIIGRVVCRAAKIRSTMDFYEDDEQGKTGRDQWEHFVVRRTRTSFVFSEDAKIMFKESNLRKKS